MDIAVKYKMIIKSIDERVLDSIKSLLKIEDETEFWNELSAKDQHAINEGLSQLDAGQHVSHQSVHDDISNRFNF